VGTVQQARLSEATGNNAEVQKVMSNITIILRPRPERKIPVAAEVEAADGGGGS
jgi:hypothetical protein